MDTSHQVQVNACGTTLTDVDPKAIWEWGLVERVSTGLLATRVGADRVGKEMLDVAEAWTAP